MKPLAILGQTLSWGVLFAAVGLLGQGPSFAPYEPEQALIKLSMAHLSQRLEPCRELSAAERAELPPTRRVQQVCERGRAPTRLELYLDERLLVRKTITPAGLSNDGRSYYLDYFAVEPGRYVATIRLADAREADDYTLERLLPLTLAPGQAALIEIGDAGIVLDGADTEDAS